MSETITFNGVTTNITYVNDYTQNVVEVLSKTAGISVENYYYAEHRISSDDTIYSYDGLDNVNMTLSATVVAVATAVITGFVGAYVNAEVGALVENKSIEEYYDIFSTNKFNVIDDTHHLPVKEFGNSFEETLAFADSPNNYDKVAIVEVTISEKVYTKLKHMNLDPFIFKSGTPVVEYEMLEMFNSNIIKIEHVY